MNYIRLTGLVVAACALALAFFTPIATYRALEVSAVEEFMGGQKGLDSLAEELTFQLDRHITQNHEDFAAQVINSAGPELCILGLCSWIQSNSLEFANSVSERVLMPSSTQAREYIQNNYDQIIEGYQSYTADIPLMNERSSNVFSVAKDLWASQTWLLFALVVTFAIVTPVIKLGVMAIGLIHPPQGGVFGALWTLLAKLSMVEVFALASIVTAYSGLPLIQIAPGWWAVSGYAVFTVAILALDMTTSAKTKTTDA